jgi:hypothetical protein
VKPDCYHVVLDDAVPGDDGWSAAHVGLRGLEGAACRATAHLELHDNALDVVAELAEDGLRQWRTIVAQGSNVDEIALAALLICSSTVLISRPRS